MVRSSLAGPPGAESRRPATDSMASRKLFGLETTGRKAAEPAILGIVVELVAGYDTGLLVYGGQHDPPMEFLQDQPSATNRAASQSSSAG